MMKRNLFFLLYLAAAVVFPSVAHAEWEHKVDLLTSFDTFGYRAAKIISNDGDGVYQAGLDNKARGEVRARVRIVGSYLHFEIEPYTIVPERVLMVNLAGIEARFFVPIWEKLRLGYYHHSSHNFNDGSLGGGIVLDGLMFDILAWRDAFEADGQKGEYRLRVNGTGFVNRKGPPYLITGDANVAASASGETAWRLTADLEAVHPLFRVEGGVQLLSPEYVPSSLLIHAALTWKPAPSFMGELGQHLYLGPYFSYGRNFQRMSEFGGNAFIGGIRVQIIVSEFTPSPSR